VFWFICTENNKYIISLFYNVAVIEISRNIVPALLNFDLSWLNPAGAKPILLIKSSQLLIHIKINTKLVHQINWTYKRTPDFIPGVFLKFGNFLLDYFFVGPSLQVHKPVYR